MKNKRHLRSAVVFCTVTILMLCAFSNYAHGFEVCKTYGGADIYWSTPSTGFYINAAGFPAGSLQAIQAAMQTWTNVTTSNFSFTYRGATTSTAYAAQDNMNLLCCGSFDAGYEKTLALNTFWYNPQTGMLLDSDIKFNAAFTWATNLSETAFDVQTIALHELGHALSLDDLYDDDQESMAMFYSFSKGQIKRNLHQDDMNGITYLYSGGSVTTTTVPSTTTSIIPAPCPAETVLGQEHPDIVTLRAFRDGTLSRNAIGRQLTQIYYNNAKSIDAALERSPTLRAAARNLFEAIAVLERNID